MSSPIAGPSVDVRSAADGCSWRTYSAVLQHVSRNRLNKRRLGSAKSMARLHADDPPSALLPRCNAFYALTSVNARKGPVRCRLCVAYTLSTMTARHTGANWAVGVAVNGHLPRTSAVRGCVHQATSAAL